MKEKKIITKAQTWQGLKLELPRAELCAIFQADEFEADDYYDYDLLRGTLLKIINKEIDFDYFIDWCILVANCFNYVQGNPRTKLCQLYYDIADFFDGISFVEKGDQKTLLEALAMLKHYDYQIKKAKKQISGPFITDNVERIMCFDHANWHYDSCVYRVIIKNYNTQEWEIKYIDDYDFAYDDNKNYSFVGKREFEKIFSSFYDENTPWREVHNLKF